MICQYCQQPCVLDNSYFSDHVIFWACASCNPRVVYFHVKDEPLIYSMEIEFSHNGKIFYYKEIRPMDMNMVYPTATGAFYQGADKLWSMPVPNSITPETVEEKFAVYATFS